MEISLESEVKDRLIRFHAAVDQLGLDPDFYVIRSIAKIYIEQRVHKSMDEPLPLPLWMIAKLPIEKLRKIPPDISTALEKQVQLYLSILDEITYRRTFWLIQDKNFFKWVSMELESIADNLFKVIEDAPGSPYEKHFETHNGKLTVYYSCELLSSHPYHENEWKKNLKIIELNVRLKSKL